MAERLRIPCVQDPVGTACSPDCQNFTYALQLLRRKAKEQDLTPEELAEKFPNGERVAGLLLAVQYVPEKLFKRCDKQPNNITLVSVGRIVPR